MSHNIVQIQYMEIIIYLHDYQNELKSTKNPPKQTIMELDQLQTEFASYQNRAKFDHYCEFVPYQIYGHPIATPVPYQNIHMLLKISPTELNIQTWGD